MYSSRASSMQRLRNDGMGPRHSATQRVGPAPKRRSLGSTASSVKTNGDYQVLKSNVNRDRKAVRLARICLASSLDQLGEHHLRQEEYDDAMDAFTEALREKRSVYSQIASISTPNTVKRSNSFSSSFLSGMNGDDSLFGGVEEVDVAEDPGMADDVQQHDKAIDEIVNTLRNLGNIHSLRGEQEEAMRYYTEVTSLRAQKISTADPSVISAGGAAESRSFLSGMNDDTSTLMTEINEDVKALDDLFRSISFRNGYGVISSDKASVCSATEKRKCKPPNADSRHKRQKSSVVSLVSSPCEKSGAANTVAVENEPFNRTSAASSTLPTTGNEVSEALEMYRSVLSDSYTGPRKQNHQEMLNSLSLRVDLLLQQLETGDSEQNKSTDLELALEIYNQILVAHEESRQSKRQLGTLDGEEDKDQQQAASLVASTLICMGSIYYKMGNRDEELQMYRQAKSVYKKAFGENHSYVAGTRKNIGMVLAERGEYDAAIEQFEKAKRTYLAVAKGKETNRDVASAISCMGNVKNRVGELDSALEHYLDALRIYKSIYQFHQGDGRNKIEAEADALRDVTSTLKVIGMVHAKKGDLDTAMEFFQESITLLRLPGIEETSAARETMASVLTRVASIYLKQGDLNQAMTYYRQSYELTVRNRGTTNHSEVAGILHYIGGIYHKRSDYDEAMACYQESIRIYHATLGPGNPTVAGTLVMVGSIYYKRKNLDSAMMFYREALRLNRDAYGMHHPDVAPILKSIGTILTKKGEYHEAYDVFRDVLSIKCTVHGADHPEVASAYKSLGNVHYKLGDLADAERQYRHALNIYRKTRGEDHADTISAKTTIEHLRYWMREKEQRKMEERHSKNTLRHNGGDGRADNSS